MNNIYIYYPCPVRRMVRTEPLRVWLKYRVRFMLRNKHNDLCPIPGIAYIHLAEKLVRG